MDFGMGLFIGLLLALLAFALMAWGMQMGLEMAVDGTRKKGYFSAYGAKWKAVEAPDSQA